MRQTLPITVIAALLAATVLTATVVDVVAAGLSGCGRRALLQRGIRQWHKTSGAKQLE